MNYRHAYHAGNFADCMKHALLLTLIEAMQRKATPFLVLDTHAGAGFYDLTGEMAAKTGEWRQGIGRLLETRPPALEAYLGTVARLGLYPGSPALAAACLRPGDRLVACELHPDEAAALKRNVPAAAVHRRDGYEGLKAFLPPDEKRALVLLDPPFERPDEFAILARRLVEAVRRFPSGVFAAWYPVKHLAPVRAFHDELRGGVRDVVAATLLIRPAADPARLNGCGLLVVNPPYRWAEAAAPILAALVSSFGELGGGSAIERVADE